MSRAAVEFDGNLTRDVELKHLPSGVMLAVASIAVDSGYYDKDKNWIESVGFFELEAYGKTAEKMQEALKGYRIIGNGNLKQDRWSDSAGNVRSKVKISIAKIFIITEPKRAAGAGSAPQSQQPRSVTAENVAEKFNGSIQNQDGFDDDGIPF